MESEPLKVDSQSARGEEGEKETDATQKGPCGRGERRELKTEKNSESTRVRPLSPVALSFFFFSSSLPLPLFLSPFVDVEEEEDEEGRQVTRAFSLSLRNQTSAMFRNSYDTDVITWSPQGRLHQASLKREKREEGIGDRRSIFSLSLILSLSLSLIPKNSFSSNR